MLDRSLVRLHAAWIALKNQETGATMPEYALVVVAIAIVAFVGAGILGVGLDLRFKDIDSTVRP